MKKTRQQLRPAFVNGQKPPQESFWNWLDSYFHLDDDIPAGQVVVVIDGEKRNIVTLINQNTQNITNISNEMEWAEL